MKGIELVNVFVFQACYGTPQDLGISEIEIGQKQDNANHAHPTRTARDTYSTIGMAEKRTCWFPTAQK